MPDTFPPSLHRSRLLMGDTALEALRRKRVIIVGVGGVGSWCAESLVRSGISRMTIVDSDRVCPTNINRQLMATAETVGQPKVEALRQRLLSINPDAEIEAREEVYCAETADRFDLESYDYIVDAIDSIADKMLLIRRACRTRSGFYSSMGAALKMDPTRVSVAEFWKVKGCPLAASLRRRFKKEKDLPRRKFRCVFSEELLVNRATNPIDPDTGEANRANGSLSHITAIFGLTIAGLIVQEIYNKEEVNT